MKLYLSVDMEGITGLPDYTFVNAPIDDYKQPHKIMTNDVVDVAFKSDCMIPRMKYA